MPRPAMLVEMVTAPLRPAWATISASRSWCLAFRTLCGMPFLRSIDATTSDFSTETVPTSTGWPALVAVLDLVDDRAELAALVLVDEVGGVLARPSACWSGSTMTSSL